MFEINKENLEQANAERMARKMLSKMMSEAILKSETAPEDMKLSVLLMDKSTDLHDSITDLVKRYVTPGNLASVETLKKVLEYLALVEVGIQQFSESTPFVPADDEEKEED